ncbi:MAG: glycosyltransferase family 4 protein [Pseudomonadota bacterium]
MSHFAKRCFLEQHADTPTLDLLKSKLMVRHPNCELGGETDRLASDTFEKFVLTFVGGHFGRKGGCVSVRVAELAQQRNLPIEVNIISSMVVGGHVWTDPTETDFFEPYLKLLELPNVHLLGSMPNSEVRDVLGRSHFCMLPTFGDTFGYSAIEAMSEHTPVIGTDICALPEFIEDDVNGLMFHLESTEIGDWANPGYARRGEKVFADHFRNEVERLAQEITHRLEGLLGQTDPMRRMRRFARLTSEAMFSAQSQGALWDDLYERVIAEAKSSAIELDPNLDISSASSAREALGLKDECLDAGGA